MKIEIDKPIVPRFVADWYENEGKRSSWWNWFYKWGRDESRSDLEIKTIGWMQDYNEEMFVVMFKYGYEVEEEQKYYVINKEKELILGWSHSAYMTPCIEGYEYMKHNGRESLFQLTEQEIKDYDERFWAFAEPIKEVEFRLSF